MLVDLTIDLHIHAKFALKFISPDQNEDVGILRDFFQTLSIYSCNLKKGNDKRQKDNIFPISYESR